MSCRPWEQKASKNPVGVMENNWGLETCCAKRCPTNSPLLTALGRLLPKAGCPGGPGPRGVPRQPRWGGGRRCAWGHAFLLHLLGSERSARMGAAFGNRCALARRASAPRAGAKLCELMPCPAISSCTRCLWRCQMRPWPSNPFPLGAAPELNPQILPRSTGRGAGLPDDGSQQPRLSARERSFRKPILF